MADVTLNLSYQETFGMTTIEGMACGTPGIVYNKTASPELVSPETGYAVEAKNIKAIVKAVLEIKKKAKPLILKHVENACLIISIRMTVLLIMWIYMIRLSYGHECLLLKQVI